jgi:hypothetical protein
MSVPSLDGAMGAMGVRGGEAPGTPVRPGAHAPSAANKTEPIPNARREESARVRQEVEDMALHTRSGRI